MSVHRRVAVFGALILLANFLIFRKFLIAPVSASWHLNQFVGAPKSENSPSNSSSPSSPSSPVVVVVVPPTPPPTSPPSPAPSAPPTPLPTKQTTVPKLPIPDDLPGQWWGKNRSFNHSIWKKFPPPRMVNFPENGKLLEEGLEKRRNGDLSKTFVISFSGYDIGPNRIPENCPFKCSYGGGHADAAVVSFPGGGGAPLTITFGLESTANSWWGQPGSFDSFSFSMRGDLDCTIPMLGQLKSFFPVDHETGMFLHDRLPLVPFAIKKKRAKISSMISNCESTRLQVLDKLDSLGINKAQYGGCGHNAEPSMPWEELDAIQGGILKQLWGRGKFNEKEALAATHLFHFAAENSICDFYHTEKLFGALKVGTVPVYMGARTVYPYLPEKSVLFVYDFPNVFKLAEHLVYLASNETAYNEYLAWRQKPLAEPLLDILTVAQAERAPEWQCDLCKLVATSPPGHYERHDPTDCEGFPLSVFMDPNGNLPQHVEANMIRDKPKGLRW